MGLSGALKEGRKEACYGKGYRLSLSVDTPCHNRLRYATSPLLGPSLAFYEVCL